MIGVDLPLCVEIVTSERGKANISLKIQFADSITSLKKITKIAPLKRGPKRFYPVWDL